MKTNEICIFYNKTKGYGIVSYVPKRKGTHTSCEPMIKLDSEATLEELKKAICSIDSITENKILDVGENGYHYWKDLGCSSFSAFVKQFRMISLEKTEQYILKTNVYDSASRGLISDKEVFLPPDTSMETIVETIYSLIQEMFFGKKVKKKDELLQITLLNDKKINYACLTDDFLDVDDYGVDAYKIYLYEDDGPSHIGFMIDCGYKAFDKEGITARWNEMYNPNISYKFEELNDKKIKYRVSAESDTCIVESNFFIAGDELVEYLVYIDKNKNINDVDKMMAEYKRVLDSIKIE